MNTKIIKTPKMGVKIELKEWITGEESEKIEAPIKNVGYLMGSLGKEVADTNICEAVKESDKMAVKIIVLKINGEARDIWKRVQEMRKIDCDFVLAKVDRVRKGLDLDLPVSGKEGGTE